MKELNITAENFSVIRETLKAGETCKVNNLVTLTGFEANTQKVGASGKITRTPFKYVSESGTKYTSTTLKELLGIEAETKGSRKETTFVSLWEQASKLAESAELSELESAAKTLASLIEAKKKAAEKAAESRKAALIAELAAMGVKVAEPKKSSRKSK